MSLIREEVFNEMIDLRIDVLECVYWMCLSVLHCVRNPFMYLN